jgi:hypothetical protein
MSYNVLAYIVYLGLMGFLIIQVGKRFHRHGRIFIVSLMKDDEATADYVNNILLVAYCLFNVGYAFVRLREWETIGSLGMMISSLASNMSPLIFILAITHYLNMAGIWLLASSKNHFFTHKTL